MNDEWDALVAASVDKGRKLRQAAAQQAHNKTLDDAKIKLDELNTEDREPAAKSEKLGQDLHTAQSLDKKHRKLEAELTGHAHAIDHTLAAGQVLIDQKHPQKDEVFLYKCRSFQLN